MTDYAKRRELIQGIARSISDCEDCPLFSARTNTVPGEGSPEAPVVFVGEGPGADEDASGRPFVGKAGMLLTKILESVKLTRDEVYITNIVKCRPPKNRVPTDSEQSTCSRYLMAQIAVINPRVVVTLGATALSFFLKDNVRMTEARGKLFDWKGRVKIFAMFHPSYLLRYPSKVSGSPKSQTWEDIRRVRSMYDKLIQGEGI